MIEEILSRTVLLAKSDLSPTIPDHVVLSALTETHVRLVADESALSSHAGQSAFVTAALLMMRSGHQVSFDAPEIGLIGPQPPLEGRTIIASLVAIRDVILGSKAMHGTDSTAPADLVVFFGGTQEKKGASPSIRVGWRKWSAVIAPVEGVPPAEVTEWPIGAMAAAGLAAAEAFKVAIRKLEPWAASSLFRDLYAPVSTATIELASEHTPVTTSLGPFDVISAGAVANALYYALLRLPGVCGQSRVFDADQCEQSNQNRNMLMRASDLGTNKVDALALYSSPNFHIEPKAVLYNQEIATSVALTDHVFVGVDDIRSRWLVQHNCSGWLSIGATDLYSVQVSYHAPGLACAGCLHPFDMPIEGATPTAAFVSFWAGLQLASLLTLKKSKALPDRMDQSSFLTPLRPETFLRGPVDLNPQCPLHCHHSATRVA